MSATDADVQRAIAAVVKLSDPESEPWTDEDQAAADLWAEMAAVESVDWPGYRAGVVGTG